MKNILCYGDSNTWGRPPGETGRYEHQRRWPGILQGLLGISYRIIEEGLCGRTSCIEDPLMPGRNAISHLPVALETHRPLDLIILMLGTNDFKSSFNREAFDVARGVANLVDICRNHLGSEAPPILLIAPPKIEATDNFEAQKVFAGAVDKSKQSAEYFEFHANKKNCHFFDANKVIKCSALDGIHIDFSQHEILARSLGPTLQEILS